MRNTIPSMLASVICLLLPSMASAQFYTITREQGVNRCVSAFERHHARQTNGGTAPSDTAAMPVNGHNDGPSARKRDGYASPEKSGKGQERGRRIPPSAITDGKRRLPELTVANLYKEIVRNGILYPEIVLAQAILETGWFRSSLCRDRNNLFGLTNPVTGRYFEFAHWTDSVKAYYTKVQYKYKGGNYLLWLREIGYAEDPEYVRSVIKVLKML